MGTTKIQWCDCVWNPIIGCGKVSAACDHCYAERMAHRLAAMGIPGYRLVLDRKGHWNNRSEIIEERLSDPEKWRPCRIFVTSMGDIFNPMALLILDPVFEKILLCREHTFIILTKRPVVGEEYFSSRMDKGRRWRNLWTGVTVEDQSQIHRAFTLQGLPGRVHFLSCEPLLGPLDLSNVINRMDWVICGAETGPGARPMNPDWARLLRDQCQAAGVPFFLKSLTGVKIKKADLPKLDGRIWDEFPK